MFFCRAEGDAVNVRGSSCKPQNNFKHIWQTCRMAKPNICSSREPPGQQTHETSSQKQTNIYPDKILLQTESQEDEEEKLVLSDFPN